MKKVGILLPFESEGQKHMIDALAQALAIEMVYTRHPTTAAVDGWIAPNPAVPEEAVAHLRKSGCPVYTVVRQGDNASPLKGSTVIDFNHHETLPEVLQGRTIDIGDAADVNPFIDDPPDHTAIVATKENRPIWTVGASNGHHHHRVSIDIPELSDGDSLFTHFDEHHMIRLLPLLHFLRTVTQDDDRPKPPLQACFMFDDPNLHWTTYGFIDFKKMAESASKHNYHVSFATIPLDGWYVHPPTAALFKRNAERLSLLVHGVNHVSQELGRAYTEVDSEALVQKGLERIERLEKKSGLDVARVMAPPHGACSEKLLAQMAAAGFEAASISFGSLRKYNRDAKWLRRIGVKSMEIINGLPVFARFPISSNCRNTILEAAYLNRPIILMGHHKNVAGGLSILEEAAQFINSLGHVEWTDMTRIARAHNDHGAANRAASQENKRGRYRTDIWPVIRRQMTEFRDRTAPFAGKLLARRANG